MDGHAEYKAGSRRSTKLAICPKAPQSGVAAKEESLGIPEVPVFQPLIV